METKYFVDFQTHNAQTGGWNYKQTKIFTDKDAAIKEYHNILATYIEYGDLDFAHAIAYDQYGNILPGCNAYWQLTPAPEPDETETE